MAKNTEAVEALLNADTSKIALAGDWHGQAGWGRYMIRLASEKSCKIMLQLGDFGFWPGNSGKKFLHKINKELALHEMYLYVTAGNHEDYIQMSTFSPIDGATGLRFHPEYPHIILMERGYRWEWAGKKMISVGGANSIDRFMRTENIDWWSGEQISNGDIYCSIADGKADIMFSHDVPAGVDIFGHHRTSDNGWNVEALKYAQKSRQALRVITDVVQPSLMFHGHYHIPRKIDSELGVLNSKKDESYNLTSVCLDKDYSGDNLVMLNIKEMSFSRIDIPKPDWISGVDVDDPWWIDDPINKRKVWWE